MTKNLINEKNQGNSVNDNGYVDIYEWLDQHADDEILEELE